MIKHCRNCTCNAKKEEQKERTVHSLPWKRNKMKSALLDNNNTNSIDTHFPHFGCFIFFPLSLSPLPSMGHSSMSTNGVLLDVVLDATLLDMVHLAGGI